MVENFALMLFMVFLILVIVFAFGFSFGIKIGRSNCDTEKPVSEQAALLPKQPETLSAGLPKTTIAAARDAHYKRLATEREVGKGRK